MANNTSERNGLQRSKKNKAKGHTTNLRAVPVRRDRDYPVAENANTAATLRDGSALASDKTGCRAMRVHSGENSETVALIVR